MRRRAAADLGSVALTRVSVRAALTMSPSAAGDLVDLASRCDEIFAPTSRFLSGGIIDLAKARIIIDALSGFDPDDEFREDLEAEFLAEAVDRTAPALRASPATPTTRPG